MKHNHDSRPINILNRENMLLADELLRMMTVIVSFTVRRGSFSYAHVNFPLSLN